VKEQRLGAIEWSPVQEATARGAALLGGIAACVHAPGDDVPTPPAASVSQGRADA